MGEAAPREEELPVPEQPTPASSLAAAVRTPVLTDDEWEEAQEQPFQSPESARDQSFAWWPVPSHRSTRGRQEDSSDVDNSVYHATNIGKDRMGLLIDPGSYGNLVGDDWVDAAKRMLAPHGQEIMLVRRERQLRVGGVGKGHQTRHRDVVIPIAIKRADGSMQSGSFQAHGVQVWCTSTPRTENV